MSANSVQQAHDELLAVMPDRASHSCPLCSSGAAGVSEKAKEVAEVAEGDRTFSETEHYALLADAVTRETASLTSTVEEHESSIESLTAEKAALAEEKTTLETRVDVLEAEKAAAESAKDALATEFQEFKDDLAQKAEVEERKTARVDAVKAAAADLGDSYFTEARVQRWAEMSDADFDVLIGDLKEAASAKGGATTSETSTEAARETSAFTGGTSPTAGTTSVLGGYFSALGRGPKAAA